LNLSQHSCRFITASVDDCTSGPVSAWIGDHFRT